MEYIIKQITFPSERNILVGYVCFPKRHGQFPGVLFLHGGGKLAELSKTKYRDWQIFLAKHGIGSFSFDFQGVGESGGSFEQGSLKNRLKDAQNALEVLKKIPNVDKDNIFIEGSSMGGHIAVWLLEKSPDVKGIVLQSAAAYGKEAEEKLLNDSFTQVIRKEKSWANSRSFSVFKKTDLPAFIAYGQYDIVIPKEVKEKFKKLMKRGTYHIIRNGTHWLLAPKNELEKKARNELFEKSAKFIHQYSENAD